MDEAETTQPVSPETEQATTRQVSPEIEQAATQLARDRAKAGRWDLDVAVFLFAVLIVVMILLFQGIGTEIVAPVALFGLVMVWLVGWRRGNQLYRRFYNEELSRLEQNLRKVAKGTYKEAVEETIEEKVQKALRERWQ